MSAKNPYQDEYEQGDVLVPRPVAWVITVLFLLLITIPPIVRHVHEANRPLENKEDKRWFPATEIFNFPQPDALAMLAEQKKANPTLTRETPKLATHFAAYESKVEDAFFTDPLRQNFQGLLTSSLREGNRKVYIGKNGWLFYQPAIDAITGYGPLKPEPDTVAKDPNRIAWKQPLPVILDFAAQLKDRNIELILVPIPVKPMIYHDQITGKKSNHALTHPDKTKFYTQLQEANIHLIDLEPNFLAQKTAGTQPVFMKQDTHWTPATMEQTAATIAEKIKSRPWFKDIEQNLATQLATEDRSYIGDLVEKLDLADPESTFTPETYPLTTVLDTETNAPVSSNPTSPITLLGDSFVNIFHTPAIGFGKETDPENHLIGAGFAQHLAHHLQTKLDVIAVNGQAATGVREAFARKFDNEVRAKKAIIWMIASRDLFLSETPARAAEVDWRTVTFNPNQKAEQANTSKDALIVEATLTAKSELTDPTSVPYPDSLYAAVLKVDKVQTGTLEAQEIVVYLWNFKAKKTQPSANYALGTKLLLTLEPWSTQPESLTSLNKTTDAIPFTFPPEFYAPKSEPK